MQNAHVPLKIQDNADICTYDIMTFISYMDIYIYMGARSTFLVPRWYGPHTQGVLGCPIQSHNMSMKIEGANILPDEHKKLHSWNGC